MERLALRKLSVSLICLEKYIVGRMDNLVKSNVGWFAPSYLYLQFINIKIGGNT